MISDDFGGDVLLLDSAEGGVLTLDNGLILSDGSFSSAVYISLFGGNAEDSGAVEQSETWWGNAFVNTPKTEKIFSSFQFFIKANPLTSKNILIAQEKAKSDLYWLIDEGVADDIKVDISAVAREKIEVQIFISKNNEVTTNKYSSNWEAALDGV